MTPPTLVIPADSPSQFPLPFQGHNFATPKTMFIIVDSGMAIRNIIRTDLYRGLRACRNLRIVIFSPLMDDDFRKETGADGTNVILEPLQKWKAGPLVKALRSWRKDVWSEKHDLTRFKEKRSTGKGKLGRAIVYNLLLRDRSPGNIDRAYARLTRWEQQRTPPLGAEFFDKYKPDLVFYSTIYSQNLALEYGAKQRGIKTCAYVVSWDNPTTKGPFPVRPDSAIVWNNIMRDELLHYHDFAPHELFVSGPPQFDIYHDVANFSPREEFFRRWNLDPNRHLITHTTGTVQLFPREHECVEDLYRKIVEGAFKQPCQLLLRLHPKHDYERFKRFENRPLLTLQLPGRRGKTDDLWNPSREDMYGLAETMYHSDVVVNQASTITIDAACFDKPVVNVAYDGHAGLLPYAESCRRIYDFNHYKKIVETKGARMTYNVDETVAAIQAYLDNPALDHEGRTRILREQCHYFDGHCGYRIAQHLIELLK